jgi:hypothetical protein
MLKKELCELYRRVSSKAGCRAYFGNNFTVNINYIFNYYEQQSLHNPLLIFEALFRILSF